MFGGHFTNLRLEKLPILLIFFAIIPKTLSDHFFNMVVKWLRRRAWDRKVAGSNPDRAMA